MGEKDVIKV
jgi:hypothetical protein